MRVRDSSRMALDFTRVATATAFDTGRKQIDDDKQGTIGQLEAEEARERARREKSTHDELQGAADELAAASQEWKDAVAAAAALPAAPSIKDKAPEAGLPDEDDVKTTSTKYSATGSFNAAIAAQIGAEAGIQDRIAKAGEKTAKNTDEIRRNLPKFS